MNYHRDKTISTLAFINYDQSLIIKIDSMKKTIMALLFSLVMLQMAAQETQKDSIAVMILQKMSDVIGELNSVSFELNTSIDVDNYNYGVETQFGYDEVYMVGPDKMLIHNWGPKGHRGFWYNGEIFTYYSFDENNYADIEAPATIIETIDTIHKMYGIRFPAADFFYPTFTIDILDNFDNVIYLGQKIIDGKDSFHVMATNSELIVQFWISNDAFTLPVKYILIRKDKGHMQYEATFSNWELNPEIPTSVFNFSPPPKARRISILAK